MQHNLAFNYPFPLAFAQAHGAHLTDVDGNRYTDFLQAGGPTLLGSNHPAIRKQVDRILDECGPVTGLLHEYEVKLAELVCESMPGVDMLRLLGSGTEAVMAAVRLARAYTRKKWVIKIGGAYHGWSDQLVYGMRLPGTGRMEAVGIREAPPRTLRKARRIISTLCAAGCKSTVCVVAPQPLWSNLLVRKAARVRCTPTSTDSCGRCATNSMPC